jgi:hypothetical protein
MAALGPFEQLASALALVFTEARMIGPDLRVLARMKPTDTLGAVS